MLIKIFNIQKNCCIIFGTLPNTNQFCITASSWNIFQYPILNNTISSFIFCMVSTYSAQSHGKSVRMDIYIIWCFNWIIWGDRAMFNLNDIEWDFLTMCGLKLISFWMETIAQIWWKNWGNEFSFNLIVEVFQGFKLCFEFQMMWLWLKLN